MMDPNDAPQDGVHDGDGGQPMDNPFGPAPGGQAPPEAEQKAMNYWGLRNSEPAVSPYDVGNELALDVEWWQHLFAGFIKQSNSTGTEAWMHYVVAAILLADSELQLFDEEEREELEEEADAMLNEENAPGEANDV